MQRKSPLSLVSGGIFNGGGLVGNCLGVVVQGGIIQGKMFGGKSPRANCPGENFMRVNCPGVIVPGGRY